MAQDKHPDVALVIAQFGASTPPTLGNGNDPTKTLDAHAVTMGAGWNRNRVQQALREMAIR